MDPTAVLHHLSQFIDPGSHPSEDSSSVTYWYEGYCPQSRCLLRLPRTVLAESIAHGLMRHLATQEGFAREGKMYGVLLVETSTGERRVLQAFSGLLQGKSVINGWVPPILGRELIRLEEAQTLEKLNAIKQELLILQQLPERQKYAALSQEFATKLSTLQSIHAAQKQKRQQQRQQIINSLAGESLEAALEQLNEQSRQAGIVRRHLKQERDTVLYPLRQSIELADARIQQLKLRRKALSRHLQVQMHSAFCLTNFAGVSAAIEQFILGSGLPTGTGDCCAPKLLHYAATHALKPLALAEFWWGTATADRAVGEFYGACVDRCQPILGFLLSGLPQPLEFSQPEMASSLALSVLYEDNWLIAIDKPAGLLTVPGRYLERQDSVFSRLRAVYPNLLTIHRLDQDTSGILLLAKDRATHHALSQQFQQRQIHKVYEAVLTGYVEAQQGMIDLPLSPDFANRPRQAVDLLHGKPSLSHFRVLMAGELTRMEWLPVTGRTHQIRVHAAVGLKAPILGDRLYGWSESTAERLHLHARELQFLHPQLGRSLHLQTPTPF